MMGHSYMGNNVLFHDAFWSRAVWRYKFSLWPKRCKISRKYIWLQYAYQGIAVWAGPGEPAIECGWLTSEEYLLAAIKGKIKNDSW